MCARALMIIPGLLRRIGRLENTVANNNAKMKKLVWLLVSSFVVILLLAVGPKVN